MIIFVKHNKNSKHINSTKFNKIHVFLLYIYINIYINIKFNIAKFYLTYLLWTNFTNLGYNKYFF